MFVESQRGHGKFSGSDGRVSFAGAGSLAGRLSPTSEDIFSELFLLWLFVGVSGE